MTALPQKPSQIGKLWGTFHVKTTGKLFHGIVSHSISVRWKLPQSKTRLINLPRTALSELKLCEALKTCRRQLDVKTCNICNFLCRLIFQKELQRNYFASAANLNDFITKANRMRNLIQSLLRARKFVFKYKQQTFSINELQSDDTLVKVQPLLCDDDDSMLQTFIESINSIKSCKSSALISKSISCLE